MISLALRKQKAYVLLPSAHVATSPTIRETFANLLEAKQQYQDLAFTQGFACIVETNDKKRGI